MKLTEAIICDMQEAGDRRPCRTLADAACALCGRDACNAHLPRNAQFYVEANLPRVSSPGRTPESGGWLLSHGKWCAQCVDFLRTVKPPDGAMRPVFDALNVVLKAAWAAEALKEKE